MNLFPIIRHVDQLHNAIKNHPEFYSVTKGGHIYFNYRYFTPTTFPDPVHATSPEEAEEFKLLREARGLVFDARTGKPISRPFHKFFNIGEKPETQPDRIVFSPATSADSTNGTSSSTRYWLLEKMDGSMIVPMLTRLESVDAVLIDDEVNDGDGAESSSNRHAESETANGSEAESSEGVFVVRYRSKMGIDTEVGNQLEQFVYSSLSVSQYPRFVREAVTTPQGENTYEWKIVNASADSEFRDVKLNMLYFALDWMHKGYTVMFEWCSRSNRIVLDYEADSLTLIGMRHIETGCYLTYPEMCEAAAKHNIPIVNQNIELQQGPQSIQEILEAIKNKANIEGFVLKFEDGRMYKIKTEWYFTQHSRSRSLNWYSVTEADIWKAVLSNELDDMLPWFPPTETPRLTDFAAKLWEAVRATADHVAEHVAIGMRASDNDRKAFARWLFQESKLNPALRKVCFDVADGEEPITALLQSIERKYKKLEEVKLMIIGGSLLHWKKRYSIPSDQLQQGSAE